MATKVKSSAPAPTDREKIWAAIRELKQFTRRELAMKAILPQKGAICGYLLGLEKAGFIRALSEKKRKVATRYELARDIGVEAPRVSLSGELLPPSGRSRMWKTMRILGTFTARELASASELEGAPIAVSTAAHYCSWLARGGYLRGYTGVAIELKRWTFIPAMDTGPKAPQILKVRKLYDPNRDKIVCEGPAEGRDDL